MNEESLMHIIKRMDKKLKEYMTPEEHEAFSTEVAKEAFKVEVEEMAEGDFKDFCLANFDLITGDDNA